MRNNLFKKGFVFGIMVLLIGMCITLSSGRAVEKSNTKFFDGNTLYVGGIGEGNYTRIKNAIDNASDGDTVFVYEDSSPYKESNLIIEKPIYLIGEDRDTTVIDGVNDNIIINTITDWVNISGFTIQNSSWCGIRVIMGDNNNISGNIFAGNGYASIGITAGNYNYIVDNIFTTAGILLEHVSFTTIIENIITDCSVGITLWSNLSLPFTSNSNIISRNLFDSNEVAMQIIANNTLITRNTISNHTSIDNLIIPALSLEGRNNTITCNNFINNIRDANNWLYIFSLSDIFTIRKNKNVWDGNYWGRPRLLPKFIFSYIRYERGFPDPAIPLPFFSFDWHPAKEPYDI